jgi:hypothetical protein
MSRRKKKRKSGTSTRAIVARERPGNRDVFARVLAREGGCAPVKRRKQIQAKSLHAANAVAVKQFGIGKISPRVVEQPMLGGRGRTDLGVGKPMRGRKFGHYIHKKNLIELNMSALCLGPDYESTLLHEMAHAVQRKALAGRHEGSHGPTWKRAMKALGLSTAAKSYRSPITGLLTGAVRGWRKQVKKAQGDIFARVMKRGAGPVTARQLNRHRGI